MLRRSCSLCLSRSRWDPGRGEARALSSQTGLYEAEASSVSVGGVVVDVACSVLCYS